MTNGGAIFSTRTGVDFSPADYGRHGTVREPLAPCTRSELGDGTPTGAAISVPFGFQEPLGFNGRHAARA